MNGHAGPLELIAVFLLLWWAFAKLVLGAVAIPIVFTANLLDFFTFPLQELFRIGRGRL